jgi:hypothetical protein
MPPGTAAFACCGQRIPRTLRWATIPGVRNIRGIFSQMRAAKLSLGRLPSGPLAAHRFAHGKNDLLRKS